MSRKADFIFSAVDHYTSPLATMSDANQRFNKEVEASGQKMMSFRQKQDALRKNQTDLQISLEKTSKSLREARDAFKANGDAANQTNLEKAYSEYNRLKEQLRDTKRELSSLSREARRSQDEMRALSSEAGKLDNRAGSDGLLKNLAGAGFTKMIGDTFSGMLNAEISSAFGADAGAGISTTLSGIVNGAAMGFAAGGGLPGAMVGGTIGLFTGGLNAATQQSQKEDEYFKSYIQESVENSLQKQASDLQAGSGIAANRETSMISFTTLFDNDEKRAQAYFDELKDMANNTPFLFDDLKGMSKVLKSFGYTDDKDSDYSLIDTMTAIGDTGAALGMSTADMGEVAKAIGRMNLSNKTTLEYLNPLIERGIPVMDYLSEGFGVAKDEIYDAVSKGLIPGQEAALCIKEYMSEAFGGNMVEMSKTFSGLQSTLQGWNEEMQAAMGEGYNEERKKGMQSQIDYLSGDNGERMENANRMIGAWKADLENQREEILRRHEREALDKIESERLDAVEGGRLLAQAQINAKAEYNSLEGVQLELESQKQLIADTRQKLVQDRDYWDAGYALGQEFSKGMKAASQKGIPDALSYTSIYGINTTPTMGYKNRTAIAAGNIQDGSEMLQSMVSRFTKAAIGIDRVPYDNFPVLLHQDERVLTAQEARGGRQAPHISININGLTVREEADVYKIANVLANELQKAQLVAINT